mmetsp:Transcript_19954/g.20286  ORF Transcript_19954/g.20286 Transcript_19954/m.20286 type:complete len:208 (-) Transcript_19954:255-878(-)
MEEELIATERDTMKDSGDEVVVEVEEEAEYGNCIDDEAEEQHPQKQQAAEGGVWKEKVNGTEAEGEEEDDEYGNFIDHDEEERGEDEEERVYKERINNSAFNNNNSTNRHYREELVDSEDDVDYGNFLDDDEEFAAAEAVEGQGWNEGVTIRGERATRIAPDTDIGIDIDTNINTNIGIGRAPRSLAVDTVHSTSTSNSNNNSHKIR